MSIDQVSPPRETFLSYPSNVPLQGSISRRTPLRTKQRPKDSLVWPSELDTRSLAFPTILSGISTLRRKVATWGIAKLINTDSDSFTYGRFAIRGSIE